MVEKIDIINRWYQKVWLGGDMELFDQMYKPGPAAECAVPEGAAHGAEVVEFITVLRSLVEIQSVRLIKMIEQDDWVSAWVEVSGVREGTAVPFSIRWISMLRIDGEHIVESHPHLNYLALFEQLGQLPQNCLELMLAGTVLR